MERISESEYRVRIDAKAAEGKANERLRKLLADYFNVRKSDVTIVHGSKSRKKAVEVAVR